MPKGAQEAQAAQAQEEMNTRAEPTLQAPHDIGDIQRARLLAAMTEVVAEQGVTNVSVADVVGRAGISRRTFYELFASREDCFLAAFERAVGLARDHALTAAGPEATWADRVRAAVYALLELFDEQPGLARFLVVETLGAGPGVIERRRRILGEPARALEAGRGQGRASETAVTPLTAEATVGGALSLLHTRICEGSRRPLAELAGPLMATIVLPYLGAAAARRELARPAPKRRRHPPPAPANPLRELPVRLTQRTVLVLQAIGARPGSSNREVGRLAGIEDQGQTSKLLKRLERVGLAANTRERALRGAPNAWTLTGEGAAVLRIVGGADESEVGSRATGDGR